MLCCLVHKLARSLIIVQGKLTYCANKASVLAIHEKSTPRKLAMERHARGQGAQVKVALHFQTRGEIKTTIWF